VFQALKTNETVGIAAIMAGMKEAAIPADVSLYLAAVIGFTLIIALIVRMIVEIKTASPPFWFYAIGGILCLVPAGLFWKAELLILEALSPGSSIAAGGIASVGAQISQLLMLSIIAAPIIFIILIVFFVLPLSSRSKKVWSSLIGATVIEILLIAIAIAIPFLINEPKRKKESVNLPANIKNADSDNNIDKETSMILTLTPDNKLYITQRNNLPDKIEITEKIITPEELTVKLKKFSEVMSPDKQIVYLKADVNASYENVLQVFDIIRKTEINKVGLVVIGEKNESNPYQIRSERFEVKLPELTINANVVVKPNPLMLVAMLKKDGALTLNNDSMGMISDPKKLENKLADVFKYRENTGILREGTNEIEKTVDLKVSKSCKYGDFIKLVEAVKLAGTEPIGIQIDDIDF
jgi:biopolymer transport protein ExbD